MDPGLILANGTQNSPSLIARFMRPTWGPSGTDRTQVGPMLAPWTLLSGFFLLIPHHSNITWVSMCFNSPIIWLFKASQITSLGIVYSTVYSGVNQRKHQSSASLAFVRRIHRGPVNSPHKRASNAENGFIWWRHHVLHTRRRHANPRKHVSFHLLTHVWNQIYIAVCKYNIALLFIVMPWSIWWIYAIWTLNHWPPMTPYGLLNLVPIFGLGNGLLHYDT